MDAAIIDQLALYESNPTFIETVTQQLESQGFRVDVYSGSEATVDLYHNLPTWGYEVIIFRAHAGLLGDSINNASARTFLFTGEEYSLEDNAFAQLLDQVIPAEVRDEDIKVFAVNSDFVRESIAGNFGGAAVIMMGCATAYYPDMA